MFRVGDKVVCPRHGAGIVEAIEEKEVLGKTRRYFVMRLPLNNMKVMVPCDQLESAGLRQVISEPVLEQVLEVLRSHKSMGSPDWHHRYRTNMEKIRSGDIFELAEVVRSLSLREREKGLSTAERKMLENARQILLSEIALAKGLEVEQADRFLEQVLAQ